MIFGNCEIIDIKKNSIIYGDETMDILLKIAIKKN